MKHSVICGALVSVFVVVSSTAAEVIHVPGDAATLQAAVSLVSDGGTIEMAPGNHAVPAGGLVLNDLGKGFTVRAPVGERAVLDAFSASPVMRLQNSSLAIARPVVWERITFYRGRSTTAGLGGGITLTSARATFIDCIFLNNTVDILPSGGGGALIFADSTAHFIECQWIGNSALSDGGGLRIDESTVYLHACQFIENSSNPPNHRSTSAGGAVHVTNGTIRVGNTRFEANEAGYAGGGLYVLGSWLDPVSVPRSDALIANCTFVNNRSWPDPSVSTPTPSEGGGVHVEAQSMLRAYNSRFVTNTAHVGGGLNLHRATVQVRRSVFRGNRAVADGTGGGVAGAIGAGSNDTVEDGANNRPSAFLTITESLIQGRYGSVGNVASVAGGIGTGGDITRRWGLGGVWPTASAAETRATVEISGVALVDCDVSDTGGGGQFDLTDLAFEDSLVIQSNAVDSGSSGGALRIITESVATILRSAFARNSAALFGGALHVQGADVEIADSLLVENQVGSDNYGAAFFSAPLEGHYGTDLDVTGEVHDSVISNTSFLGMPIFDDDRQPTPINDVRYNDNSIYERQNGNPVYWEALVGIQTVSQLNSLVVNRAGGPSTDKSQSPNTNPSTAPVVGDILAVPPVVIPVTAVGDAATSTESHLVYAWSGGSATLDGGSVTGNAGSAVSDVGLHTLRVAGQDFTATVIQGVAPAAQLFAVPQGISSGETSTLQWSTPAGTFVDASIDQGVTIDPLPSGQVVVAPTVTTTYRLVVMTEEGSVMAEVTVWVDEEPGLLFRDGFESGNVGAWSRAVQ
jgi:hypothetical protein